MTEAQNNVHNKYQNKLLFNALDPSTLSSSHETCVLIVIDCFRSM